MTITEPADFVADRLAVCEFETDPFTDREERVAYHYFDQIGGLVDIIDSFDGESIHRGITSDEAHSYIDAVLDAMREWWMALDSLHSYIGQGGEGVSVPEAPRRLIQQETTHYFRKLNTVRREIVKHFVGDAGPSPVDSGYAQFSNFPSVEIGAEAVV